MRTKLVSLLILAVAVLAAAPAAASGSLSRECRLEKRVCVAVGRATRRLGRAACLKDLQDALGWCYLAEVQAAQVCDPVGAPGCLATIGTSRKDCVKAAKAEAKECQQDSSADVRAFLKRCREAFDSCLEGR